MRQRGRGHSDILNLCYEPARWACNLIALSKQMDSKQTLSRCRVFLVFTHENHENRIDRRNANQNGVNKFCSLEAADEKKSRISRKAFAVITTEAVVGNCCIPHIAWFSRKYCVCERQLQFHVFAQLLEAQRTSSTTCKVLKIQIKPVSILSLAQAENSCLHTPLRAQGRSRAGGRVVASLIGASLLLEGRCNVAWDVCCKLLEIHLVRWCQKLVPVLR
jgi:hypothetical protein